MLRKLEMRRSASKRSRFFRPRVLQLASKVQMELLEQRVMLTTTAVPNVTVPPPILPTAPEPLQGVVGTPNSLNPQIYDSTFGFSGHFYKVGSNIYAANGADQTIAIVDAYGSPTITNDVQAFDKYWGVTNFDSNGKFFLTIQPLSPTVNTVTESQATINGWAEETALDVEWAHSVAPGAHILLVEAPSASLQDMLDANVFAAAQPGVVTVSNSWGVDNGASIFKGEPFVDDGFFVTPTGHIDSNGIQGGVAFFASSGDPAPITKPPTPNIPLQYPATSGNVVSVGGMTIGTTINGTLESIGTWSGSQGGLDTNYVSHWQEPFVSFDADPNTGVWVYSTAPGGQGWQVVGGTSLACPTWAAYTAIIDQGLGLASLPSLNSQMVGGGPGQNLQNLIFAATETNIGLANATFETFWGTTPPAATSYPLWPMNIGGPTPTVTPSNGNTGWGLPRVDGFTNYAIFGDPTANFLTTGASTDFLSFVVQPTNAAAGVTMAPVEVEAISRVTGLVDTAVTGAVTLQLGADNPATLNGTVTQTFVNGIATFTNLSINTLGGYVLYASAPNIIPFTSNAFDIGPSSAASITVTLEPGAAWQFGRISPISATILDQFGNIDNNNFSTVSVSIGSGPVGAVLSGLTIVNTSNGVATFSGLSLNMAGVYTIKFTDDSLTSASTATFTVVPIPIERRFLFNSVALGPPIIMLQQSRNSAIFTQSGPPTQADITAVLVASRTSATPMFSNGYVAVSSSAVPAGTFAAGSPLTNVSTATALLDSTSSVKKILN